MFEEFEGREDRRIYQSITLGDDLDSAREKIRVSAKTLLICFERKPTRSPLMGGASSSSSNELRLFRPRLRQDTRQ